MNRPTRPAPTAASKPADTDRFELDPRWDSFIIAPTDDSAPSERHARRDLDELHTAWWREHDACLLEAKRADLLPT